MPTTNLPNELFKLAVVRAPRRPMVTQEDARRVSYDLTSALHSDLVTDRGGVNARANMIGTASAYASSAPEHIIDLDALKVLFPGFDRVDDHLRTMQRNAVKAALKSLVESTDVLGMSAAAYVAAAGYNTLKARLWDNVFVRTVLGDKVALRTEEVRSLRILNLIEKIASDDPQLSTGAGIWSVYMATVVLPSDVFPMPHVPLPTEPVTQPAGPDPVPALVMELDQLKAAYKEISTKYDEQVTLYRTMRYPDRKESDPNDDLQRNVLDHDPLELSRGTREGLKGSTKAVLEKYGIGTDFVYMPFVHERMGSEIRRLGRMINDRRDRQLVVRSGGMLIQLGNECVQLDQQGPCSPFEFAQWHGGAGHVRPIGICDLKVVRTQLYKYELGEVAHVENILKGEKRTRTFRDLRRQESTFVDERETTRETETETQTTERFEVQQEASNVIQQDQANQAGVTISGGYGPVQGSAYYDTASSTSQVEATSNATTFAKDVMERALQRVVEKTRTRRTVTTIIESEDTTEHAVDNTTTGTGGADHVVGVYRWLDKLYYNKVVNYGRRMMFEFVVPEPGAFHLFAKLAKPMSNEVMEMPPPFTIRSFEDIRVEDYDSYAVQFGATNVKPPPQAYLSVQATASHEPTEAAEDAWRTWVTQVKVPEGYVALSARATVLLSEGSDNYITLTVGSSEKVTRYASDVLDVTNLPLLSGDIPIVMRCKSRHHALGVQVFCKPSAETFQQWQIDTYAALRTAYDQRVSEYNRWLNQQTISQQITGSNPGANRDTERTELKKHCISFITGQRYESFDALRNNVAPFGYPEFSFAEATKEGKYIQFFEQGFEWEQMTYLFYPYYWARKKEWVNILHRNENDPLFAKFLQAGAARVLVPVRPGYEKAILHYLNTGGEIWNGDDVPTPDDPMYVSIIDEIMEADGNFQGGDVEGEPWLSKVPTSLVYLTHGGTPNDLPDFSADLPL